MNNVLSIESWHNLPTPAQALETFLIFKKATGTAPRTIADYHKNVGTFFRANENAWNGPVAMRTPLVSWLSQEVAPTTYNLRLVYLRAFFTDSNSNAQG